MNAQPANAFETMSQYVPARLTSSADLPWIPSPTPGKSSRPLGKRGQSAFSMHGDQSKSASSTMR